MRVRLERIGRAVRRWWLPAARLLLLWLLVGLIRPAPPRAPLDAPQTVVTTKPLLCVHTRLIDEVDEWKIQRSLQLVREMGVDTIVEFFPWAYIEGAEGYYNWAQADRIVRHARNQGIHIIARMGYVPAWAQRGLNEDLVTLNTLPRTAYDDFAAFVAAFAARYAGVIDALIIWNEPNLAFEWGYQTVDPAGYVELLRTVYPAAHAANPHVTILAAPLAPTLEPIGSPSGLNDLLYLETLYDAGLSAYYDVLAAHTYGFRHAPEADPAPDRLNFRRVELLREVMTRYGDADKPIIITETGWNDHPRWTNAVEPSQRIAYTLGAYEWAADHWDWLDKLCLWAFRFPADTFSYPDYYSLVTVDFQLKPIYHALKAYSRGEANVGGLWLPPP